MSRSVYLSPLAKYRFSRVRVHIHKQMHNKIGVVQDRVPLFFRIDTFSSLIQREPYKSKTKEHGKCSITIDTFGGRFGDPTNFRYLIIIRFAVQLF